MIVEIPAGTTAKWEMNKSAHQLVMDSIDGRPRFIDYIGYPGNYGMIPGTLLKKEYGGDGDPLDVLLLGNAINRGTIVPCKIIGVLKLLDNGEQDDKLIAVPIQGNFSTISSLGELKNNYPGVVDIIAIFFTNYKGKGEMVLVGWGEEKEAQKILENAHDR